MSNKITKKDREGIERVLSEYRNYEYGTFWKEFVNRWETTGKVNSEQILRSLKRQANKRENRPEEELFTAAVHLDLVILFKFLGYCVQEMTKPAIRPKERQEIIDRIGANAKSIIRDMFRIGLPATSTPYFTQAEISTRFHYLLPVLGLYEMVEESQSFDWDAAHATVLECMKKDGDISEFEPYPKLINLDDAKEAIQLEELDRHDAIDFRMTEVLVKLTDGKLLDSLASPADVSKTESQNYQRIFVIRKLTQYFSRRYGEGLQETTANISALIFGDESIDRSTVRSALSGFSTKPEYTQPDSMFHFRLSDILGHLEEGVLERAISVMGKKSE